MKRQLSFLVFGALLAAGASADTLSFSDLMIPKGLPDRVFSTTTTSTLGLLENSATLSFTLTTYGETWLDELRFSITDPSGSTRLVELPNAPDSAGDYSGSVNFATLNPGSGAYTLSFANKYETAFDLNFSNLKLEVAKASPVPEPSCMAALGLGAAAFVRRRTRTRS